MSTNQRDPIAISESELGHQTDMLEDVHRETLPHMRDALEEWSEQHHPETPQGSRGDDDVVVSMTPTRRGFLVGAGALLGSAVVLRGEAFGLGRHLTNRRAIDFSVPGTASMKLTGDLAVVALAAAIENLAVGTYQAGIDAATAGNLGTVPPAVVTFAQTAQSQHGDHAAAWNAVLEQAGKPPVTGVDKTVKDRVVDPAFAQVKDVGGLAKLALELENAAAATYLAGIGVVKSPAGIKTAATIQPVELQHAAILNFVLGQYPVPDTFANTTGARTPQDKIG
jgi:hypothetical protein